MSLARLSISSVRRSGTRARWLIVPAMLRRGAPAALLLCVLLAPLTVAVAQETVVRETQTRLQQLQEQIAEDEARLRETRQQERTSASQLNDLERQIALREELVALYDRRTSELRAETDSLTALIDTLQHEVTALEEDYRKRATHAYKYGRQHDVALILAAESINQMLVRIGYLRRFSNERRARLADLAAATATLSERRSEREKRLVDTQLLLDTASRERETLAQLRNERSQEVTRLRALQVDLSNELENKRTMARELSDRIVALMASAEARPAAPGRPSPRVATGDFAAGRGVLSWPTDGAVVEPFGERIDPVYGTRTPNPGILIATTASAGVRAAAGGVVSTVDQMPDIGSYIIMEHGDFHTVYGNFSLVYVATGDQVAEGDLIGRAGTTAEPRGSALFFGIFENAVPVNPLDWLLPR
ncbi:MAG: peptidase M23 [Bacteroidetes bacterium CG12_big_fil_rev_8_21_14_0_65_60_17]|nr:MAG: peptidase M23 [Bacteroidetes bacterium CG12_big_fil_rev_8_21_14_0_65_60_17]